MTNSAQSASAFAPVRTFLADALSVRVYKNQPDLASDVTRIVEEYLVEVIARQGSVAAILATGNSQIQFLDNLVRSGRVDWSKVTLFHMDEYLGMDDQHKASFRRYMREKVESKLKPKAFHYIKGDCLEPYAESERYTRLLEAQPIDLCCLGIGENGHLAFNDPPVANFDDKWKVKLVQLDTDCKMQQVREGHFPNLEAVPPYAFTLTIPALCSAKKMVCVAPETRKAKPVKATLQGPISSACPASILRKQSHAVLLIDNDSAALL
ncbi:MAG: Glucosamine/galactosamine-6-phosphate isomerase [Verrucomicrobiales bacterium]|nr:Glucosamine/galactosamine-6-phosphate isomerase [Verrucomicrobiales bacterium]